MNDDESGWADCLRDHIKPCPPTVPLLNKQTYNRVHNEDELCFLLMMSQSIANQSSIIRTEIKTSRLPPGMS